MNNNRSISEDSLKSSGNEEITQIFKNNNKNMKKRRKREKSCNQSAKSPEIQYWLNIIINNNKVLTQ